MKGVRLAVAGLLMLGACAPTAELAPVPAGSGALSASPSPSPTPFSAPSDAPPPPPGTTPFPTPGPTITPGSTRVIGTIVHPDGSPAAGVCVVLEKGLCPIATDENGVWFTDIPAGPINWNFIYRIDGQEAGRQLLLGSSGGELRLPAFTLPG